MPLRKLPDHIAAKITINQETGCWIYKGTTPSSNGYERCWLWGMRWQTHRLVYELIKGGDIRKLELDHKCEVIQCCNPDHMDPVSGSVNCKRKYKRNKSAKVKQNE